MVIYRYYTFHACSTISSRYPVNRGPMWRSGVLVNANRCGCFFSLVHYRTHAPLHGVMRMKALKAASAIVEDIRKNNNTWFCTANGCFLSDCLIYVLRLSCMFVFILGSILFFLIFALKVSSSSQFWTGLSICQIKSKRLILNY